MNLNSLEIGITGIWTQIWRNYILNHKHISNDIGFIYKSLASRREGVAPLSYGGWVFDSRWLIVG